MIKKKLTNINEEISHMKRLMGFDIKIKNGLGKTITHKNIMSATPRKKDEIKTIMTVSPCGERVKSSF